MRGRIFTVLSVLSLVLCVVTCVLWARSYRQGDVLGVALSFDPYTDYWRHTLLLESSKGEIFLGRETTRTVADGGDTGVFWHETSGYLTDGAGRFAVITPSNDSNVHDAGLVFPAWSAVAVILMLAGLFVRLARLQRPDNNGRCSKCGYDLRATPDRCPECGTIGQRPT